MEAGKDLGVDSSFKNVIIWGGLSLFFAGAGLAVFVLTVILTQQQLPVPAGEMLSNPTRPMFLFILAATGEFLLIPGAMGLYFTLRNERKSAMLFATILYSTAAILFLVSRGFILSLSRISADYLNVTDESLKTVYLVMADLAIETQDVFAIMAMFLLSIGSIIIGAVMLRVGFGKRMGYLVITAGCLTVFAPFLVKIGLFVIPFFGLVLTAVWQTTIGLKVFKLGKSLTKF